MTVVHAAVTHAPTDAAALAALVARDDAGASVTFEGVVRDHDGGRAVTRLSYTAHPSAAEAIARVAGDVAAAHPATHLAVVHRVGDLAIGDVALACAVSSAHRGAAFVACADLVDAVKAHLPVWKEQFFADGTTEWVGSA